MKVNSSKLKRVREAFSAVDWDDYWKRVLRKSEQSCEEYRKARVKGIINRFFNTGWNY